MTPTYEVGDKVKIVKPGCRCTGKYGKVIAIDSCQYGNLYRVNCSGYSSPYLESSLELITKKEKEEMKKEKLTGYNKIAIINIGGKNYCYALYDDNIKENDYVMVSGTASDYVHKVIEVREAAEFLRDELVAEVIGKVDTTAYDKRVEVRKRKAEIKASLDKKIAELDEMDKYARYAKLSPEFAELFEQLKALEG